MHTRPLHKRFTCILGRFSGVHANAAMHRVVVLTEKLGKGVDVDMFGLGCEVAPHARLECSVKAFNDHGFAFIVRAVHLNIMVCQPFFQGAVVKFLSLIHPQLLGLSAAGAYNVLKGVSHCGARLVFQGYGPGEPTEQIDFQNFTDNAVLFTDSREVRLA